MEKDFKEIKNKVKSILKNRGIRDYKTISEFTQTFIDDYKLALENGMSESESMEQAASSLNETLDSYKNLNNTKTSFSYALVISIITFISCIVISLIGWLVPDALYVYSVLYPILFLISLIILIFGFITFKKRTKFDLLISLIIFLAVVSIFIECLIYFYRIRTGDFYYSLGYTFPGILDFNRYELVNIENLEYKLSSTIVLFDPTLVISFISLLVCLVINFVKQRCHIKK